MEDLFSLKGDKLLTMSYEDFVRYCMSVWPRSTTLHFGLENRFCKTIDQQMEMLKRVERYPDMSAYLVLRLLKEGNLEEIEATAMQEVRMQKLHGAWAFVRKREFPDEPT